MDTVADAHPSPLRADLLGPVCLSVGDRPIPDDAWPRRTTRSLLPLLLVTPGHRLRAHAEWLVATARGLTLEDSPTAGYDAAGPGGVPADPG